jgi:hypothetical protein
MLLGFLAFMRLGITTIPPRFSIRRANSLLSLCPPKRVFFVNQMAPEEPLPDKYHFGFHLKE